MSAGRQAGTTVKRVGDQDDIRSGLAALQAQMEGLEVRMDERFEGLAELIDAKLSPIREMAVEQRTAVQDHGQRLTQIETVMDREIVPAVKQTWKTQKDVAQLQEHAKRCDERSHTSSSRWWGVAQGLIIAAGGIVLGWVGALIWAGLGR